MASIKISELRPVGSELFQDSESFLNELTHGDDMTRIMGGGFFVGISVSVQTKNGNSLNANTVLNANTAVVLLN